MPADVPRSTGSAACVGVTRTRSSARPTVALSWRNQSAPAHGLVSNRTVVLDVIRAVGKASRTACSTAWATSAVEKHDRFTGQAPRFCRLRGGSAGTTVATPSEAVTVTELGAGTIGVVGA